MVVHPVRQEGRVHSSPRRSEDCQAGLWPEASNYDVQRGVPHDTCEYKGFLRHGTCKHTLAVRAILANGWMPVRPKTITITREMDGVQVEFRADGRRSLEYRDLRENGKPYDARWWAVDAEYRLIISRQWLHLWDLFRRPDEV